MRNIFMLGMVLTISFALMLTSCKKEEMHINGDGNGNTENPGGGGPVTPNQEYPSTAVVLPQAVTDIDGNTYDAVQIGEQVWMAQNLRTTRYADGTSISMGSGGGDTEPYRYAPGPNQSNEENMDSVARYGYLYNWPAVMHGESNSEANPSGVQGICPDGWHVPSDAEWTQMIDYMATQPQYMASGNADHLAKALASTFGWDSSDEMDTPGNNPDANNATGFSALPTGLFLSGSDNSFGILARFWTSTENRDMYISNMYIAAYGYHLGFDNAQIHRSENYSKKCGFSVRCVRD